MNDSLLTPMPASIVAACPALPTSFPNPFACVPHPLAMAAAKLLQQRLEMMQQAPDCCLSLDGQGKMFGVLVVRTAAGELCFLSAFSGMVAGQWHISGFVPPVCDQMILGSSRPDGAEALAELTQHIQQLEQSDTRRALIQAVATLEQQRRQAVSTMKAQHRQAKEQRRLQRQQLRRLNDPERLQRGLAELAAISKHQDREAASLKRHWRERLQATQQQLTDYEQRIDQLKVRRGKASRQLHRRLFDAYELRNALGERKLLRDCFADGLPPGGSGDCAAPKLIHYAVRHQLKPVAMAEFWWGESPSSGIRLHGHFYPACRGKCRPILPFMLRGISVDPEPDHQQAIADDEPRVMFEDDYLLLINKPAGLLSVPGKVCHDSVFSRLQQRYPDCPDLRLVHRLDMDTSGLLLVAKNLRINSLLQKQFMQRNVEKRYEALLDGLLPASPDSGIISLPLRVDLDDRPRQMVCYQHGKQAITRWQRVATTGDATRVFFYPETGRTHQLRAHAAHRDGLHTPIVGDMLYGRPAVRMMLHAQRLCFRHPVTEEALCFEAATPF